MDALFGMTLLALLVASMSIVRLEPLDERPMEAQRLAEDLLAVCGSSGDRHGCRFDLMDAPECDLERWLDEVGGAYSGRVRMVPPDISWGVYDPQVEEANGDIADAIAAGKGFGDIEPSLGAIKASVSEASSNALAIYGKDPSANAGYQHLASHLGSVAEGIEGADSLDRLRTWYLAAAGPPSDPELVVCAQRVIYLCAVNKGFVDEYAYDGYPDGYPLSYPSYCGEAVCPYPARVELCLWPRQ